MTSVEVRPERVTTSARPAPWWVRSDLFVYLATAFLTCGATFTALKLWRADLHTPFYYWGDAVAVGAHFKTVLETGWYEYNPDLGAPAGQTYHDFPTADNLHLIAARVLSLFTDEFAVAMNLYYLIGFLLAGLTAVWFFRVCGISKTLTVPLAVLFAIAPYHFLRSEGHLWLGSYYALPLALGVVLWIIRGEPVWGRGSRGPRALTWFTGRGAATVVMLALIATSSSYYAVFVLILIATSGIVALVRDRRWRRFWGAALAGIVTVAVMAANMAPDILYTRSIGPNAGGFVRNPAEVEIYALKLSQLLLPVPGHRIEFLRHLRASYDTNYPMVSESPSLGSVAAIGLGCLLVLAIVRLTGHRVGIGASPAQVLRTRTLSDLAALTLVAFLCSTVGGLATLLSFLTASLRGWNRMSIVIAALCLAAVGLMLDALLAWLARGPRGTPLSPRVVRGVAIAGAGILLVVGYLDQVTPKAVPEYAEAAVQFDADADWVATLETELPDDAMVFQLPYSSFPETPPVNGVYDTDQLRPYLLSTTLRWSGASIKGRSVSDWTRVVASEPPAAMVTDLSAVGFSGIVVDRQALGAAAADLEAGLSAEAGPATAVSETGRFAFYSLAEEVAQVDAENPPDVVAAVGAAVIAPTLGYPQADLLEVAQPDGSTLWTTVGPVGHFVVDNGRTQSVRVRLSMVVSSTGAPDVTIRGLGAAQTLTLSAGTASLDVEVVLPPGQTSVEITPGPKTQAAGSVETVAESVTPPAIYDLDRAALVRD